MERVIATPEAMGALGAALAVACGPGLLIRLTGELGTGKTTLTRGFLAALGHAGPVRSPTYTLVEPYEIGRHRVYHLDLYRVADPEELEFLGLRDLLDGEAVCLVEWPERAGAALPAGDLTLHLAYRSPGRQVTVTAQSPAGQGVLDHLCQ
ncbi:MAG: tRNA (adenosine(37)-N6)-threonylcarbamoyltransferase complex ATPase subunit type 1 TsaE [Chromatiales bacterium 21-64-14]|nr:MAG: tRNA (adenosine(37)-N6)-threonylcarbamoyltransferase complex ATPase subunit type 1 TsaE [Chromatiales bacterium 21-64-14]HQU14743.1 tRNA (adenosine(37)-N6)-threonylcarbamoyltransferase complex ATPase subunit type 1 TsaE [Gammaproteobacteria bacterium]